MNQSVSTVLLIREHQGTISIDVLALNVFIMKAQPNDSNTAIKCWAFFHW